MRVALLLLLSVLMLGCSSNVKYNQEPYILRVPEAAEDRSLYLAGYESQTMFYGHETSFSMPFLKVIPVVGSFLGDQLLQFRSGAVRPIFLPVYKEKTYATPALGSPGHPTGRGPFRVLWN